MIRSISIRGYATETCSGIIRKTDSLHHNSSICLHEHCAQMPYPYKCLSRHERNKQYLWTRRCQSRSITCAISPDKATSEGSDGRSNRYLTMRTGDWKPKWSWSFFTMTDGVGSESCRAPMSVSTHKKIQKMWYKETAYHSNEIWEGRQDAESLEMGALRGIPHYIKAIPPKWLQHTAPDLDSNPHCNLHSYTREIPCKSHLTCVPSDCKWVWDQEVVWQLRRPRSFECNKHLYALLCREASS